MLPPQNTGDYSVTRFPRTCARCGKSFFVIRARAREGRGLYCSMACRRPYGTDRERFWLQVDEGDGSGCWNWTGARLRTGYGAFGRGGKGRHKNERAHRVAWEFTNGPVPQDLCVLHRCDNRLCVRPDHLFLGTYADNHADMVAKGRRVEPVRRRGTAHGNAKLTEAAARDIRDYYEAVGGRHGTIAALARKHGVSTKTVHNVLNRKVWTHA